MPNNPTNKMKQNEDLKIREVEFDLPNNNKGKIAVFLYSGELDPTKVLNWAVSKYVGNNSYNELIDAGLDNPWMRIVLSDMNEVKPEAFDPTKHQLVQPILVDLQ